MKKTYKTLILKYRRILILATNLFLVSLSYYVAYLLRFDCNLPVDHLKVFFKTLPFLIFVKLLVFYYFGLFRGLWRYVSIYDLEQIIKANVVSTVAFILGSVFLYGSSIIPRFIFVVDFIICTFFIGGIRFLSRIIRERYRGALLKNEQVNVLIVGAGEDGILLLKE